MKKNVLIKGIFLLILLALLTVGFTGCGGSMICTTGTVYIDIVNDSYAYWVYIDGNYQIITNTSGYGTIYNVPIGYHTFYALASDYYAEGTVYNVYVGCGANNVAIPVY